MRRSGAEGRSPKAIMKRCASTRARATRIGVIFTLGIINLSYCSIHRVEKGWNIELTNVPPLIDWEPHRPRLPVHAGWATVSMPVS